MIPIEKIEKKVLLEIVLEMNVRMNFPLSFIGITLQQQSEDSYTGSMKCTEPAKTLNVPVEVVVTDNVVKWSINKGNWNQFEWENESEIPRSLLEEAEALKAAGKFEEALKLLAVLEAQSRHLNNTELLKEALFGQGSILFDKLKKPEEALVKLREHKEVCEQAGDRKNLMTSLWGIGLCLAGTGTQFGAALDTYHELATLSREQNNKVMLRMALGNAAEIYFEHAENPKEALTCLAEHETLCRELKDFKSLNFSLRLQAKCYMKLNYMSEAYDKYEQRIDLLKEMDWKENIPFCLTEQGYILSSLMKKFNQAFLKYEEAERACRETDNQANLKVCLQSQSYLLTHELKKYDEALEKNREWEAICLEMNDASGLTTSLANQAFILLEKKGDYEEALAKALDVEALARKFGGTDKLRESLKMQITIHKAWGEKEKAKQKKSELKELSD
ncbi:hypothetical protein ACFLS7_00920 [Bacteroidota bacterium]